MKRMKFLCIFLSFCMIFSSCGFLEEETKDKKPQGELTVKFLDVSQGDCELIILPDETVILIDGGDAFCSEEIVIYLENEGFEKIDYIVASHPHADHIGGLDDVFNSFEVGEIILPEISKKDIPTTVVYEKLLRAIKIEGCKVTKAENNLEILNKNGVLVECLGPVGTGYGDLNEYSAIIKLTYGENTFLFMGDATEENEKELLKLGEDIDCDVLKVGHHGSSTSSSEEFLDEAAPDYAVISAGEDNRYGHPHRETLNKFSLRDIKSYITKDNGTIVMVSDGAKLNITTTDDKLY